jgi:hypothetical protein
LIVLVAGFLIYSKPTLTGIGREVSKVSTTYASGRIDTVLYNREGGVAVLAFAVHTQDSSNITNIVLRRVVDGVYSPVISADSLVTAADSSAAERVILKSVTLNPMPDQYAFIVKYKANNGGLDQGVSSPTVVYEVLKSYTNK